MNAFNLNNAAIYVGTYHKYNCGSIAGKWFQLSEFADDEDFLNACREYHSDENDPELMFQDWEYIPKDLISESYISPAFFNLRDRMDGMSSSEADAFFTWLEYECHDIDRDGVDELISRFHDEYMGEYADEASFAEELTGECYEPVPEYLMYYIDYEKMGRDLTICDYWYQNGYVFRRA